MKKMWKTSFLFSRFFHGCGLAGIYNSRHIWKIMVTAPSECLWIWLALGSWCFHKFRYCEHQRSGDTNVGDTNSRSRIITKHRFRGRFSNWRPWFVIWWTQNLWLIGWELRFDWIQRPSRILIPFQYVARPLQTKMTDFWRKIRGSFRTETKEESQTVSKRPKRSRNPVNILE